MHLFINLFTYKFTYARMHSLMHLCIYLCTYAFTYALMNSLIHFFSHLCTYTFTYAFMHSLTYLCTHLCTYAFTYAHYAFTYIHIYTYKKTFSLMHSLMRNSSTQLIVSIFLPLFKVLVFQWHCSMFLYLLIPCSSDSFWISVSSNLTIFWAIYLSFVFIYLLALTLMSWHYECFMFMSQVLEVVTEWRYLTM